MKEPRYGPFILVGVIAVLLLWGMYYFADSAFGPTIKEAHTAALLDELDRIVSGEEGRAEPDVLIESLGSRPIEWNSCRWEEGVIYDGWGRAVSVDYDDEGVRWSFRSAGIDGEFGTGDDIVPSP